MKKKESKEYIVFKNVKKIYEVGEVMIEDLSGATFSIDERELVIIAGFLEQEKVRF